jgi:hypothetical protein
MVLDKTKLALIVIAVVIVAELGLIGCLAGLRIEIPDPAWSVLYASLGILAGVAGAQYWNGHSNTQ